MNSFELSNDSEALLLFEISYYLRMREGAECRGSPWLRMRGSDLKF